MKTLNLAAEEICGAQRMMKTLNFPVLEVAATLEAPNTCSFPIARCAMGCCVMGDAMERSCAGAVVRSSSTETETEERRRRRRKGREQAGRCGATVARLGAEQSDGGDGGAMASRAGAAQGARAGGPVWRKGRAQA
ncbi:hypothetical protein U1Q18_039755 [Sarracenia purpurea var. burkii]